MAALLRTDEELGVPTFNCCICKGPSIQISTQDERNCCPKPTCKFHAACAICHYQSNKYRVQEVGETTSNVKLWICRQCGRFQEFESSITIAGGPLCYNCDEEPDTRCARFVTIEQTIPKKFSKKESPKLTLAIPTVLGWGVKEVEQEEQKAGDPRGEKRKLSLHTELPGNKR